MNGLLAPLLLQSKIKSKEEWESESEEDVEEDVDTLPILSKAQLESIKEESKKRKERVAKRKLELLEIDKEYEQSSEIIAKPFNEEKLKVDKEHKVRLEDIECRKIIALKPAKRTRKRKRIEILNTPVSIQDRKESDLLRQKSTDEGISISMQLKILELLHENENENENKKRWIAALALGENGECPWHINEEINNIKVENPVFILKFLSAKPLPSGCNDYCDLQRYLDRNSVNWKIDMNQSILKLGDQLISWKDCNAPIDWSLVGNIEDDLNENFNDGSIDIDESKVEFECGDWDDPVYASYKFEYHGIWLFAWK